MAGYIVYWPGEQVKKLKKAGDTGPIRVVLGSIHAKMPAISSVKPGDVVYPVTLEKGVLQVLARLPVERVESAFDYLLRETGDRRAALIPRGVAYEEMWSTGPIFLCGDEIRYYENPEELPPAVTRVEYLAARRPAAHLAHEEPFNCCAKTAVSGSGGSPIRPRPIPAEKIPSLLFGPSKAKQKPLKLNAQGKLTSLSLAGVTRRMSDETKLYFDTLFDGEIFDGET